MGYLKEKYTKNYFLKQDASGNFENSGVEGAELFLDNKEIIRIHDLDILRRINFNNKNVLEFGFGRGESLNFAKKNGANSVCGVDFSEDAFELATDFLKRKDVEVELYCDDALNFFKKQTFKQKFDIVIMFDFVEHVPRTELFDIFTNLKPMLNEKSIIAITTPVFKVDNDVILEGLKKDAKENSDEKEKTAGMHCNRYTLKSLKEFMLKCGFTALSGHFYINGFKINKYDQAKPSYNWSNAFNDDYPILPFVSEELFEYAQYAKEDQIVSKNSNKAKKIIKQFVPPIIINLYKRITNHKVDIKYNYNPQWYKIENGILKSKNIFIDPKDGYWRKEMIDGTYDQHIFNFLDKFDLKDKVIFEIGSHIGYDTMCFASLVGESGKVICFEPNKIYRERMGLILSNNKEFTNIELHSYAVSDYIGETDFKFSDRIDNSYNSMNYPNIIKTIPLDKLNSFRINEKPALIKIDAKGAENFVLNGAYNLLHSIKPIVVLEIYSINSIYYTINLLIKIGYNIEQIKEEVNGRYHLVAY